MKYNLGERLRCLLDQPVRIYTDDERRVSGFVVGVNEEFVRILDFCGDIFLVNICHITSIEEPHMKLRKKCCKRNRCETDFCEEDMFDEDDGKGDCGCKKHEDRY